MNQQHFLAAVTALVHPGEASLPSLADCSCDINSSTGVLLGSHRWTQCAKLALRQLPVTILDACLSKAPFASYHLQVDTPAP